MERDTIFSAPVAEFFNFNSHAHVERDAQNCNYLLWQYHFNSHAHVERDVYVFEGRLSVDISTHTLTWSVTGAGRLKLTDKYISTHTLTWSVTL